MANHTNTFLASMKSGGDTSAASDFVAQVVNAFGEHKWVTDIERATYVSTQYKDRPDAQ